MFELGSREDLRKVFQPSRLLLAVTYDKELKRMNFFPVAFNMYCSYNPLLMAIAIQNTNYSFNLFKGCNDFVLAIPGESMSETVMKSGLAHGSELDKFQEYNLHRLEIDGYESCGINECIANIACQKFSYLLTGDHAIVVGEVKKILVDSSGKERNLVSTSPYHTDLEILQAQGIHRLGVISSSKNKR